MEALIFRHRGYSIFKRILGAAFILIGVFLLFFDSEQRVLKDWIIFGLMIILGLLYFTPLTGSDKSCINPGQQDLRIRWRTWYREKLIRTSEIDKIVLGRLFILINIKDKKAVRIPIDLLEVDKRTEVYNFFIEFAKQKNLVIERHGLSQE